MKLVLSESEQLRIASSWKPTRSKLEALGMFLVQQVKDRFANQGAPGPRWPVSWPTSVGYRTGRSTLTGRTGRLLNSFNYRIEEEPGKSRVVLFSDVPYAKIQQLGTVGKGGELPTIKPVSAKALFVPITDRAASSERHTGPKAVFISEAYGSSRSGPMRMATRGLKSKKYLGLFTPLRRGRIKDGQLEVWNEEEQEYVLGTPDFIFLAKMDIAPRPMLPTTMQERETQKAFIESIMGPESKDVLPEKETQ